MRGTLSEKEIRLTVDLLVNKYELSTKFLNKLFGRDLKYASNKILNEIESIEVDKKNLCRLLVVKEGINLFFGSSENKRELRRKILEKMSDSTIIELYNKYPDTNKNITTVSYMRTPLVNRKWYSGKLFSVCGLSATPGRNTIISENEVDKLVNRFQMNLITPEFKDHSKYKENPLEYFKEYKYLSKVNHIVFKSNIEYKLTERELKDLEDKKEYSPSFLKKIAEDTKRNIMIIKRLIKIKRGSPTLVYACTVEHAKFLATMLNILGRRSAYIDSNTNKMERRIIIKQFTEVILNFCLIMVF